MPGGTRRCSSSLQPPLGKCKGASPTHLGRLQAVCSGGRRRLLQRAPLGRLALRRAPQLVQDAAAAQAAQPGQPGRALRRAPRWLLTGPVPLVPRGGGGSWPPLLLRAGGT